MPVYDAANVKIGTVREICFGSEPGTAAPPPSSSAPHSFIDDLARALAPDELPEPVRARLRRDGFIRIDVSGPFASDRYAFPDQIRDVSSDAVVLAVPDDDLVRR